MTPQKLVVLVTSLTGGAIGLFAPIGVVKWLLQTEPEDAGILTLFFFPVWACFDSGVLTAPCGGADNSSDVDRFGEIGSHIWSTIYLTIRGGRLGVLKSGLVLAAGVAR